MKTKPYNEQEARAGKMMVLDGHKVTEVLWGALGISVVKLDDGGLYRFSTKNGRLCDYNYSLQMLAETQTWWFNVYKINGLVETAQVCYKTKELAEGNKSVSWEYLGTKSFEIEV